MKLLKEEVVYRGKFMDFVVREYEINGKVKVRQMVRHPGAVAIVPVLPDGRVIYERQYRFAVGDYIYELPAGTLERGEEPLRAAQRELVEETGYRANRWRKLAEFYLAPGYSTEYMHLYVAEELEFVGESRDEDEDITLVPMSLEQMESALKENLFKDAKTLVGTLMYLREVRGC
ncbi:MAG: NUDIX hydrolase [Thermotogae bacterium]|nr:NUDIX hydrolase [Thermotogota bacterium]